MNRWPNPRSALPLQLNCVITIADYTTAPVTGVSHTHCSILFSKPHCSTLYTTPTITDTNHSMYNEPKMSTYPCYIPPQTPACTFDALTSSPGIFYETLMHPATLSRLPHNVLHFPSCLHSTYLTSLRYVDYHTSVLINGKCAREEPDMFSIYRLQKSNENTAMYLLFSAREGSQQWYRNWKGIKCCPMLRIKP